MADPKSALLAAAFALALASFLSCSGDGGGDDMSLAGGSSGGETGGGSSSSGHGGSKIVKSKITGVSQKGPFVEGTRATLYELDGDFAQTGRQFFDIIADNKGTFEIKNVELVSPYAALEADGYYRNEVTGQASAAPIKLYAIADVREKDNVNVNILTHLEYYRVLDLAEGGKTVAEAKKQAQKEILAVFGIDSDGFADSEDMTIFGTTEGDAVLLAISILLQGNLGEGEFSQRLTNFAQSLRTGGKWENEDAKAAMADWASAANLPDIKSNILAWGLSSEVPDFEKYVADYRIYAYGLGDCDSSNAGEVKNTYKNVHYVCKRGFWLELGYREQHCQKNDCQYFADSRDNRNYSHVSIGNQTWMAENLAFEIEGSKCYGEDGEAVVDVDKGGYITNTLPYIEILGNCQKYGRLYNWKTAKEACPPGWHLPSREEWKELDDFAGRAGKLKSKSGWNNDGNGSDEFGFAALPGGEHSDGIYSGAGNYGYWWGSSEDGSDHAHGWFIVSNTSYGMNEFLADTDDSFSLSVRCLQD